MKTGLKRLAGMKTKTIKDLIDCADWYKRTWEKLQAEYGPYARLMAGLIAATSPQRAVKHNLQLARQVLEKYFLGEDWIFIDGLLPNHVTNIKRMLAGEPMKGFKVRAFYENLTGNLSVPTVDGWMLKYFKFKGWITPNRYKKIAAKMVRNAKRHGLKPAEYQAIIWVKVRGLDTANRDMFDGVDYV